jgi:[FeFe] hydrogenase H-cluster maturation GTPase HydF
MELLPVGPVVFIDTAGLDDTGELGKLRIEKTYGVLRKCNLAIFVTDMESELTHLKQNLFSNSCSGRFPASVCLINAISTCPPPRSWMKSSGQSKFRWCVQVHAAVWESTKSRHRSLTTHYENIEPELVGDLIHVGDIAVLVTPIDKAAPKGRLILPQQQTIRDIIEYNANAVITKEHELKLTLKRLNAPPAIVITDSQAFHKVSVDTPSEIPLTSFSILFARQKADLAEMVRGIKRIESLASGDKVLIVEGCTHHLQSDDIGSVKIPRFIRQIAGEDIQFEWARGACYPRDISNYEVIVHCGGCMLNRREMQYRIEKAREQGVYITNYGVLIACVMGILPRAIKPFPAASMVLDEINLKD